MKRPTWDTYFMNMAEAVRSRSNCSRRHFGAVIVGPHKEVVSTGYNGTPSGVTNCFEGGCPRCADDGAPAGVGYDLCFCVHAEENALLHAAPQRLEYHSLYVTGRPCIICLRHIITKRIDRVFYLGGRSVEYAPEIEEAYHRLAKEGGVTLLSLPESEETS